jgi:hypothetical protein
MKLVYAVNNKELKIRDIDTGKFYSLDKKGSASGINNVTASNGAVVGKGFNLDRFSSEDKEKGRYYICKLRVDKNSIVTQYMMIDNHGNVKWYDEYSAVKLGRVCGLVNGSIDINGKIVVSNIRYVDTEGEYKSVKMSPEEYWDLFRLYEKEGLIASRFSVSHLYVKGFVKRKYAQSDFDGFMESYKIAVKLLMRAKRIKMYKIYKRNRILDNLIVEPDNDSGFYYKVDMTIDNVPRTLELMIIPKDIKILHLLKYKGVKLSSVNNKVIENLVVYNNYKMEYTSADTIRFEIDNEDTGDKFNKFMKSSSEFEIINGRIRFDSDDNKEIDIKNNTKFRNSDIVLINSKID